MKRPRKEKEWLDHIRKTFSAPPAPRGIGDDCAVLEKEKWCVTTDTLVEGIDFERGWAPPEAVGWKALAVNLSDLAAMGARPAHFLLTLAIPPDFKDEKVEKLLSGMAALASKEKVSLVGGDLSRSPDKLYISITAFGFPPERPLMRGKARPGEPVYVSGPLGCPAAALSAMKNGARLPSFPLDSRVPPENVILDRFFRPPSQSGLGEKLAGHRIASSAIDISDGLLLDLSRLLEGSGCGAVLNAEEIPRAEGAGGAPVSLGEAMKSGEEQILLFTVRKSCEKTISRLGTRLFRIGFVSPKAGLWMQRGGRVSALRAGGFDHFGR